MSDRSEQKRLLAERRGKVEAMMGLAIPTSEIIRRTRAEYVVSERQVFNDISIIRKRWRAEAQAEGGTEEKRDQLREMLRTIARKALGAKQYAAATGACNRLMELDGLKQVTVEVKGEVGHSIHEMKSDDKRKRLQELMDQAMAAQRNQGRANGHANGRANGHANGHANGDGGNGLAN